jgi:DNA-binding CsgD family transcriptional regulator
VGTPSPLLERDTELDEIASALRAARKGRGRLLMIEGPAGIGKTRLLEEVRRRATRRGLTVLAARGGELEREFTWGIVRQLLEPRLHNASRYERERLLVGAASSARSVVADAEVDLDDGENSSIAVLHGLYWLVANLAAEIPVALVVDDAHFADPASLKWLSFITPRLDGVPLLATIAVRSGEPGPHADVIAAVATNAETRVLRPAPLSPGAVAQVVRRALTEAASAELCDACHRATAGNPFLVGELVSELTTRPGNKLTSPDEIARLRPGAVARAVLVRIGRLPPSAADLAKAVAVLGDGTELRDAAALADQDLETAEHAADLLTRADVLAAARPLSFVHPIVRGAIDEELGPGGRAAGHARAAKLLAAENAPAHDLAPHLLASDPTGDSWVVSQLRAAAAWSLARGAPDAAVSYLTRAFREPPAGGERPAVLFELGRAENRIRAKASTDHLKAAVATAESDRERVVASLELGLALFHEARLPETVDVLEHAIREFPDVDSELQRRLEEDLISFGLFDNDARPRVRARLQSHAEQTADESAWLLATLAFDGYLTARSATEVAALAEAALANDQLEPLATGFRPGFYFAVSALVFTDRYELALRAMARGMAEARRQGSAAGIALTFCFQAMAEYRQGRLADAEVDARASLEIDGSWTPMALATLAEVLLEYGDVAGARAAFDANPAAAAPPPNMGLNLPLHSRGRLLLAEGAPEAAHSQLLAAVRREREWGVSNPSVLPWRSSVALAYSALGRAGEARELAEEELALARSFGAPRAIGIALRVKAMCEPREEGIALLDEAVRTLEPSGADLEHAHALVELGAALRRAGHRGAARERLRACFETASRCGAVALAERARRELRACGLRVQRTARTGPDALTTSERRVAELVAEGASNREAAQALFVTEKTIETHLASVYRKLSIHSRRDLAMKLTEPVERAVPARTKARA